MQKLVSIAMCTYNGSHFLHEQIESILTQTYTNIELVIVDDGSTDDTVAIMRKYASEDSRVIQHINEKNLGLSRNFEHAITLCSGDLIALSDQDDVWHPEKIAIMTAAIASEVLVYHDSEMIDDKGKSIGIKMSDLRNHPSGTGCLPFMLYNAVPGHGLMFKKEYLKHLLPFPDDFYHDWWIAFVLSGAGSIRYIDKCLVGYRQHFNSTTDITSIKHRAEHEFREERVEPAQKSTSEPKRNKIASKNERLLPKINRASNLKKLHQSQFIDLNTAKMMDKLIWHFENNDKIVFSPIIFLNLIYRLNKIYYIQPLAFGQKLKTAFKDSCGLYLKITYHKLRSRYISRKSF